MRTEQDNTSLAMGSSEADQLRLQVRQLQICVAELLAKNQSLRCRLLSTQRQPRTLSIPDLEAQA